MTKKLILDLCGGSGAWSKPYRDDLDYEVVLITLPDNDVRTYVPPSNVYGVLAAPPCDEFSQAKRFHGKGNYIHNFIKGMETVNACMRIVLQCQPVFWALENPVRYLNRFLGEPNYIFDAWEFGDSYQKVTGLWGNFNPPIKTVTQKPEGIKKFSLLLNDEIHPEYLPMNRKERRAITPIGFAEAFKSANP